MAEELYPEIFSAAAKAKPKRCAVALVETEEQVGPFVHAERRGLIRPVFVGRKKYDGMTTFIRSKSLHETMAMCSAMLAAGEVEMIFQGNENRKQFLSYFLENEGLDSGSTYGAVFYDRERRKTFFVIDPLVAVKPVLEQKVSQVNALAGLLTSLLPRRRIYGAALAPIETINPKIPSTVIAAVLAQMSTRQQFGRRLAIHGPLDVDCALSKTAAIRKGVFSEQSGNYDFYVLPDTNSAYFFSTFLKYIGQVPTIGVLLHGDNAIVLNSGPLCQKQRLAEIALAVVAREGRKG
ncbi:MAG: hypothetical protein JXO49_06375 [Deltaproteobacteria bacterium]|nr:hypothetical protein [Candidatus Anaeroferrophillus wilburensis]MBN2888952.1 hypothetical protein [Deltaproteobacteria bacterium]